MKKKDIVGLVICLALTAIIVCLIGCAGVTCDARHSALVDTTAAAATVVSYKANLADTCPDCIGEFTRAEMKDLLKNNAAIWQYFQLAKSGQGTFPTTGLMGE